MKQVVQAPGHELKAQELQRAFDALTRVPLALTQSYQGLQGRVESLTAELAVANSKLRRQYEEKENAFRFAVAQGLAGWRRGARQRGSCQRGQPGG